MRYPFTPFKVGGFKLLESNLKEGDLHLKRYAEPGISPRTQYALAIYAEGVFTFAIPTTGFVQTLRGGETSLDMLLGEYPALDICEERVVSPTALRYCVSPTVPLLPWTPSVVALAVGGELVTQPGDCIYLMQGEVQVGGSVISKGTFFSHVGVAVALEASKLVLARMRTVSP